MDSMHPLSHFDVDHHTIMLTARRLMRQGTVAAIESLFVYMGVSSLAARWPGYTSYECRKWRKISTLIRRFFNWWWADCEICDMVENFTAERFGTFIDRVRDQRIDMSEQNWLRLVQMVEKEVL